jgi:tRNA (guanine-N7-)-methyltransferase
MRLRRKPWARPELLESRLFAAEPAALRGHWHDAFDAVRPLHLELGCGKGEFIAPMAVQNPYINFLAVDIKDEVLVLAKRQVEAAFAARNEAPGNVRLTAFDIGRIPLYLAHRDQVERIYLNFPNPWPKGHHLKRRLTHPVQLRKYAAFLYPGGEIWLRTDDQPLFIDSLRYLGREGFFIRALTCDLEKSEYPAEPRSEHQRYFVGQGVRIQFLIAVKK